MLQNDIINALEDVLEQAKNGEVEGAIIIVARAQLPYTTYAFGAFNAAYTRHALSQVASDVTLAAQREAESGSSRLN